MGKWKRWVCCGDTHGDKADPVAIKKFLQFCDDFRPDLRIHGGDAFDFRPIRNGANETEREESMVADVECGLDFLSKYKPDVWLLGNHDDRILDTAKNASSGVMRDAAGQFWDRIDTLTSKVQKLPYDSREGVYRLGDLSIIHGVQHGRYVAAQVAQHLGSNALMHHVHSTCVIPLDNLPRHVGHTSGCLCELDPSYMKRHRAKLKWNHGFTYGFYSKHKTVLYHAVCEQGIWNIDHMGVARGS